MDAVPSASRCSEMSDIGLRSGVACHLGISLSVRPDELE